MFTNFDSAKKSEFLGKVKAAREERAGVKVKEKSVVAIQACVRGFLARRRFRRNILEEFDSICGCTEQNKVKPALELFRVVRKFFFIFDARKDEERFAQLCCCILAGMDGSDSKAWYVVMATSKDHVIAWIHQLKEVLWTCCTYMKKIQPDSKLMTLYLHMLVTLTDSAKWKILKIKGGEALSPGMSRLCSNAMGHLNTKGLFPILRDILLAGFSRTTSTFTHATLTAVATVAFRPLLASKFSQNLLSLFMVNILAVPGLVHHLATTAPEILSLFKTHGILKRSLDFLMNEQNLNIIFNSLEGSFAVCLLANIVNLGQLNQEELEGNASIFVIVVTILLLKCQEYVTQKKSNTTHWHPILGWFSQKLDHRLINALGPVVKQMHLLWSSLLVQLLFRDVLQVPVSGGDDSASSSLVEKTSSPLSIFRRFKKQSARMLSRSTGRSLTATEVTLAYGVCEMYQTALATLTQLKLDILTGLSNHEILLPRLWKFMCELGGGQGTLKLFTDILAASLEEHPTFSILTLVADCASHLIVVLDDVELYEQQKPFLISELVHMSKVLNGLVFKMIWDHHIAPDSSRCRLSSVMTSAHTLLMVLYERDCRKPFTPPNHWLIKDLKMSTFHSELDKGRKRALVLLQLIPHAIPHKERVILFRKQVLREKEAMGLTDRYSSPSSTALISVCRSRLVEDGYRQLTTLSARELKGVVRVKFINQQGLDEAGIDQDGVFKEFLEETIKSVFDPGLNLFKMTDGVQRLYPSPTSHIQDNHLQLFEFVGRMLAKALYEGIVVEVPFAPFFLSQVLGHSHRMLYSPIDELPSLDPDMYKSLTFIKHYDGDMEDLELTFCYEEEFLGKLVTHELMPGGRLVKVDDENKISYIHRMAHFRMHTQIRHQTVAFIRGFHSLINPDWLSWFSTPELQKLISGDSNDFDLGDLRKHTNYYGGFHGAHRVIIWLWDVLEKDFTAAERALFLKFVTSCSKPPLLGFEYLEPPFSIRCVEVSEDQDTGDTLGSVMKGFFTIGKKELNSRLPTSSTCFNLLKLPNYKRKSTLREKLRYSVTSNTGFELS